MTCSVTLSTNLRFDGVKEPSVSLDQVNDAALKPILFSNSVGGLEREINSSSFLTVYRSNNSVYSRIALGQYEQQLLHDHAYIFQKVVNTVKGDFTGDRLADNEEDDMELIPEHVEYGHGTEHDRGAEFALHDHSAMGERLSDVDSS